MLFRSYYDFLRVHSWHLECARLVDGLARGGQDGFRVVRGGSWYDSHPEQFRCQFRAAVSPDTRHQDLGFRVARTITKAR